MSDNNNLNYNKKKFDSLDSEKKDKLKSREQSDDSLVLDIAKENDSSIKINNDNIQNNKISEDSNLSKNSIEEEITAIRNAQTNNTDFNLKTKTQKNKKLSESCASDNLEMDNQDLSSKANSNSQKFSLIKLFGIGPYYLIIHLLTVIGVYFLNKNASAKELFNINGKVVSLKSIIASGDIDSLKTIIFILAGIFITYGIILYIFSVIISRFAKKYKEGQLVKTGVYRYTRNPIYASIFFVLSGIMYIIVPNVIFVIVVTPIIKFILRVLIVIFEEIPLKARFGMEYVEYKKNVNRIIPFLPKYKFLSKSKRLKYEAELENKNSK